MKKTIKQKVFEKSYVKHLEHSGDRKFFASCFELKEDVFTLREGLSKAELKKLKLLFKDIKNNRKGGVKLVPLFFAAAVAAALVIFFTVFANPLLERAMEMGLEAAFEAKSDVDDFRLNLIRFRISIGGITVANRDSPMQNLFQMSRTVISLKSGAVLRGKIYIEEIRADSIRFGTARTVSGALPEKPPKVKKEKPKSDAPPLVDLQNFDAMALLDREYSKLNTPLLYDKSIAAYNETLAKWQGQVDLASSRADELKVAAQPLLSLNVNNIRDIETITRTVQDISTMVTTVQTAADDAAKMVSGIEDDINTARNLEQSARTALTDDINHLKSYINLGSGAAFSALEPSIREVLSDSADQYLDYGLRALEIIEKLKAQVPAQAAASASTQVVAKALGSAPAPVQAAAQAATQAIVNAAAQPKTAKPKKVVFKGRDVNFPTRTYPAFYLGVLASDFTLDTWNWAFDLRDISSNPDLTNRPVSLTLGLKEDGGSLKREVAFKGSADFRTTAQERFSAGINGKGFPVSLGNQLSQAGINGFTGNTAFSMNLSGRTDGGAAGGGDVSITQARVVDPEGTLAQAVADAVEEAGSVDLGIQYTHAPDRNDEFKITTNINELINRAVRNMVNAYAKKAMDEVERVLRERIADYIDGRFVSKEEMDTVFKAARGDKAAVDQLKNTLANKKTEFEQKLKTAADQAVQQAKDEAVKQGQEALQDVLQGKQPSIKPPSLPGGLKLPGR
ncbi:hypothetical protein AGMMS49928_25140 [Spirochaetia bacterium]|nr:hypothetical protein AGMMS49928_25140 [Spirochaetia bacterium]